MRRRRYPPITRVRRSALAQVAATTGEPVVREGRLMTLVEPDFLSLVKSPANRTPFTVVRSDSSRRRRRTMDGALLSVQLPAEVTQEQAEELFVEFGLSTDQYIIDRDEDGVYFRRTNRSGEEIEVPIRLAENVTAIVDGEMLQRGVAEKADHPGITILRFAFPGHDRVFAEGWLAEHEIDAEIGSWINDDPLLFCRHEAEPPEDSVEVKVDDDVIAIAAQTRQDDIPIRVYRQVIEELYGSYGFGILDFNQALANSFFTHDAREANHFLWDTIDNILFYSDLSLADRQALVINALNQFAVWLTNLMQALPRTVTESSARIDLNSQGTSDDNADRSQEDLTETQETADMSAQAQTQSTEEEEVTRQETDEESTSEESTSTEDNAQQEDQEQEQNQTDDETITLTRAELNKIVADSVSAAFEQVQNQQREDASPAAQVAAAVTAAMKPVVERLDKVQTQLGEVQNTTVTREDADDDDSASEQVQSEEEIKRIDPWRGSFMKGLYDTDQEAG